MRPYYEDDLVTIYHGDCREWMPEMRADALISDPPYGLAANYGRKHGTTIGDATTDLLSWIAGRSDLLKPNATTAVFCGWNGNGIVADAMRRAGLTVKTVVVWDKTQPGIGSGIRDQHEFIVLGERGYPPRPWNGGNVWRFPKAQDSTHPNEKPLPLMRALVGRLTDARSMVFDPFMGTGSTIVAAKSLDRYAIGIEIEEKYCEIAARRCSQEVLGLS